MAPNPFSSEAAGGILNAIQYAKEAPLRRELMQSNISERQAQTGSLQTQIESRKQDIDMAKHMQMKVETLDFLKSYQVKKKEGQETTDEEDAAAWIAKVNNPYMKDKSLDEAVKVVKSAKGVRNGLLKYKPQFEKANESGQGFRINREQDPQFFEALHGFLGSQIKEGTDRTGQPAQDKSINSVYYDPSDQTVAFGLQVRDSKGATYYPAATYGRNANPNAQVVKVPIGLIEAQNRSFLVEGEDLNSMMIKLGDKEARKKWDSTQTTAAENREFSKGEQAVISLLKKNPKATLNELEMVYSNAVGESGIVPHEKIIAAIKAMKSEKQPPKEVPPDVQKFEAHFGYKPEDRGSPPYKKDQDEWDEKESKRRTMEKVKEKSAGRAPTDKTAVITDESGVSRVVNKGTATSKVVTDEKTGQPVKGKKEMSSSDVLRQQARETGKGGIAEIVDDDDDIPDEQKQEFISAASSSDMKLTARQAVTQAKKQMGIEKKWTEKGLRADMKAHKMSDKEIDAYIKKAKASGKL